ncbi:hypothetical protein ACTFIY_006788 [Dictyostelium cf. discoideum]
MITYEIRVCTPSSLTDFSPNIGRDLALPEDIPRAAIITFDQTYLLANSRNSLNETSIFEITLGKYYLNSISSLSANDLFGSLSHYNSFVYLFNEINNGSKIVLSNLVVVINTLEKFSTFDSSKLVTIRNTLPGLLAILEQLVLHSDTLSGLIKNSNATLSTNIPNAETYTAVINNYNFVSSTLTKTSEILKRVQVYLSNVSFHLGNVNNIVGDYELLLDDNTYLSGMNLNMKNILKECNLIYNDLFLFSKLADYF